MADEADETRWLQSPEPGEARIHFGVGEGAELTPELRLALDDLARALEEEEVQGYAKPKPKPQPCPKLTRCKPFYTCQPFVRTPCAVLTSCNPY